MRRNKQCTEGAQFILPGLPLLCSQLTRMSPPQHPFWLTPGSSPRQSAPSKRPGTRCGGVRLGASTAQGTNAGGAWARGQNRPPRRPMLLACLDMYYKEERQLKGVPRCSINVVSVSLLCALRKMLVLNASICR